MITDPVPNDPGPTHRPSTDRHSSPRPGRLLLWIVAFLATAAAGLSCYLYVVSREQAGQPAGCGPDSDCSTVLTSRWANVAGIPVSAVGSAAYALLAITTAAFAVMRRATRRIAGLLMIGLLTAVIAAAGWFVFLQAVWIRHWCPYCLAVHVCGGTAAVVALIWLWQQRNGPTTSPIRWRGGAVSAGSAVVLVSGLAVAQGYFLPPPQPPPKPFIVRLDGSMLQMNLGELPAIGSAESREHVIVLVDYTCHYCRRLHETLRAAERRYGDQVSFTLMPVPLDARCNPYVAKTQPDHLTACDLAKLALAVWKAKPAVYREFDTFLFTGERAPDVQAARNKAADLLGGPAALSRAEAVPWIDERLKANMEVYRMARRGKMPKLVFQDRAVVAPEAAADVYQVLEFELRIRPRP